MLPLHTHHASLAMPLLLSRRLHTPLIMLNAINGSTRSLSRRSIISPGKPVMMTVSMRQQQPRMNLPSNSMAMGDRCASLSRLPIRIPTNAPSTVSRSRASTPCMQVGVHRCIHVGMG